MLALVNLGVTLGVLYFLAGVTDMNVYVTNTASIVGIGVGIDYALFVVTRFREELRQGRSVAEAVPVTLATSGRAVALSGATVIVALAGMFLVDIQAFRSMAIGSMSVVAVAVLAAITLLPAVLSLVGHWVDRLRIPVLRPAGRRGRGLLAPLGGPDHAPSVGLHGRRPGRAAPAGRAVRRHPPRPAGSQHPARRREPRLATEHLAAEFGARVTGPMEVLVDTPGGAGTRANLERVDRLTRALQGDEAAASVQSLTSVLPRGDLDAYARLYAGGLDGVDPELAPAVAGLANWDRGADLARITVVTGRRRVRGGRGPGRPGPATSTSPPPGWPGRPGSAGPPPTTSTWPARSPASSRWSSCPSWPCRSCCWPWPSARCCCRCRRSS